MILQNNSLLYCCVNTEQTLKYYLNPLGKKYKKRSFCSLTMTEKKTRKVKMS